MLKITMDEREKQLQEFDDFTKYVTKEIVDITSKVGWTIESISQNDENFFTCPYDSSHRITEKCLDTHLPACQWKAEGYGELDVPFPESALPPNAPSSLQFDEELQDEILRRAKEQNLEMKTVGSGQRLIPRTSTRLISDFTRDERKALYEYAITHTIKPEIGRDITDINKPKPQDNDNKEMSLLELLVQERNLKRRRAKHRGVHTNKKSQVEILREVINQQMEIYTDYILEQQNVSSTRSTCSEQDINTDSHKRKLRASNHYEKPSVSTHSSRKEKNGHQEIHTVCEQRPESTAEKHFWSEKYKKHERRSPHSKEISKKLKQSEHKHRSSSRDHKSHKKHKHKSKDRYVKRKHKSRDRDRSPRERSRSKYNETRVKDSYWSRDK